MAKNKKQVQQGHFPVKYVQCPFCSDPFYTYDSADLEAAEKIFKEKKNFADLRTAVSFYLHTIEGGGITYFETTGNYGSTLIDCEGEVWGFVVHDRCLALKVLHNVCLTFKQEAARTKGQ